MTDTKLSGLTIMPDQRDKLATLVMNDYRLFDECMSAIEQRKPNIAASVLLTAVLVTARKYEQETGETIGLFMLVRGYTELYERLTHVLNKTRK